MKAKYWTFEPLFKFSEFMCKCGKCKVDSGLNMRISTITKLEKMRRDANFLFVINSGWRCANHPEEAKKKEPGTHYLGYGIDVRVSAPEQIEWILDNAEKYGFHGIGKGLTFVHLDDLGFDSRVPRPAKWNYS